MDQDVRKNDHEETRAETNAAHRQRARWIASQILPLEGELRRALRRRAPTGLEVDDIVQEIYARFAAFQSVDHIHNPRSYAFRMASGVMMDHARRQKVVPIHGVDDLDAAGAVSSDPSPEVVILHRDQLRHLARIFANLPPQVAEVFRLRRIEGLSQKEVSLRLRTPESTIEKRMARGVYLLAQSWEAGGKQEARSTKLQSLKLDHDDRSRDR